MSEVDFTPEYVEKSPQIQEYLKFKGKMNVYAFLDLINEIPSIRIKPHSGQMQIINAYEERIPPSEESLAMGLDFEYRYRVLVACCGRRFGKSVVASLLGAQELLVPNSKVLIVSYTLKNCKIIFNSIYRIIKALGIELVIDKREGQEIELENGSTLTVASNDNVQAKLGTSISLLIIDEAKLFPRSLFEQVLLPMTFDLSPYSRSVLISSPQTGWLEKYYEYGQAKDKPYHWSISLPTSTNPTIPRRELEAMKRDMPKDLYDQEVLGLFTSAEGLVFREFKRDTHVFKKEDYPYFEDWLHDQLILNGIDSGYSHYFSSLHVLYYEDLDTFFVFNEYMQNKTVTSVHADNIIKFEEDNGLEVAIRYADPAASQQLADLAEYGLCYNKAQKQLKDTIQTVNSLLFQISEVTGKPKLLISEDCPELIRELSTMQWKVSQDDQQTKEQSGTGTKPFAPDKDEKTDWDAADNLRYLLHSFCLSRGASISGFTVGGEVEEYDREKELMEACGFFKVVDF